jgi:BolA protein
MTVKERIRERLVTAFAPTFVEVVDESHHHAGHAGARPGGETHFRVTILAPAFADKTPVQRHRLVYAALEAELSAGVHALAIKAGAPEP